MVLTDRDKAILCDIQTYGLMPTNLLAARHFGAAAKTTFLRRLRILENARYIERISGLDNGENAWCMTETGARQLNGSPAKTSFPKQILEHDLTLMRLRLKLEESGVAHAWTPEHVIRKRMAAGRSIRDFKMTNIPDGLMGIVSPRGNKLTYAIELEMTSKSQKRYRNIFDQYVERRHLQAFWYIVRTEAIADQLMKAADNEPYCQGRYLPFFVWSYLDEVLADPLSANLYDYDSTNKLSDVILTREQYAQIPAHPVSRST